MTSTFDESVEEWGKKKRRKSKRGKVAKNVQGGKLDFGSAGKRAPSGGMSPGMKLRATLDRAPEAVVKLTGGGFNTTHIKANFEYISREGTLALEDERGELHLGLENVAEVRDAWATLGHPIPHTGKQKREALNVVLSMPAGTDRAAVTNAARDFAQETFSDHQYVFVQHDDEDHSHVHLTVKKVSRDGVRLNPRKEDLQGYRETFALKLRDHGIYANATQRTYRGKVVKAERAKISQLVERGGTSHRKAQQVQAVTDEVTGKTKHRNPHAAAIRANRAEVVADYGRVAKKLARSADEVDRKTALDIVDFVKTMPALETKHEKAVREALRTTQGTQRITERSNEQTQDGQQKGQGNERI